MPSAEQTDRPGVVHEVAESVGADEGGCAGLDEAAEEEEGAAGTTKSMAGATEGATEGAAAGLLDSVAAGGGELGLSEGSAAGEGATTADDGGCSTGGALDGTVDVLSLSPEPPGTVQPPMGVH